MEIQMYNMGLGECFLLKEREDRLLVNCGTRNKRISQTDCGNVYRKIWAETGKEPFDFLMTQFDPEHISGFLQSEKVGEGKKVGTIYLPDLFSERWMNEALALLLLQDLLKGSFLPGKAVTLIHLMEVLLKSSCTLCFVGRGDRIGRSYQVLWPQREMLKQEVQTTLQKAGISEAFYEQDRCMWKELVRIAARMREIFMRMRAVSGNGKIKRNEENIPEELEEEVHRFRTDFRKLRRSQQFLGMAGRCQEKLDILKSFHERTGVIFHNREDGRFNFLYTGNSWKERASWLEKNQDGLVGLHSKYWCITLPGHGTDACYWDFSEFDPKHFLISNGYVAGQETGKVSGRYTGMFAVPGVTMHCTSSDWCEGHINGICSCWEARITAPSRFSVIEEN